MTDYLSRLAARSLDRINVVEPRLPSMFEPLRSPLSGSILGSSFQSLDIDNWLDLENRDSLSNSHDESQERVFLSHELSSISSQEMDFQAKPHPNKSNERSLNMQSTIQPKETNRLIMVESNPEDGRIHSSGQEAFTRNLRLNRERGSIEKISQKDSSNSQIPAQKSLSPERHPILMTPQDKKGTKMHRTSTEESMKELKETTFMRVNNRISVEDKIIENMAVEVKGRAQVTGPPPGQIVQKLEHTNKINSPRRENSDHLAKSSLRISATSDSLPNKIRSYEKHVLPIPASEMPAFLSLNSARHFRTTESAKAMTMTHMSTNPTVQVTIGRIEVRATQSAPQSRQNPPSSPVMSLGEYLRQRTAGGSG